MKAAAAAAAATICSAELDCFGGGVAASRRRRRRLFSTAAANRALSRARNSVWASFLLELVVVAASGQTALAAVAPILHD